MVLKVAYGYEVSTGSDDFIDRIENFFQETEKRLSPLPSRLLPIL